MRITYVLLNALLLIFCLPIQTFSADITNVSSSGTLNWNVSSTWVGGVIPGANDNVILRGVSGGVVINVPSGTHEINNLVLPNSINLSLVLASNSILEMNGSIYKRGTVFGSNMITSGLGNLNTGGRIRFVGNSRNIAPGSDVDQINNFGIRDRIKNWICEIAFNAGETATVFSAYNFKCGSFILSSGNFEMQAGTSLMVDRNFGGTSGNGFNGLGSVSIASSTSLVTDYIGRRNSSTSYIDNVTISDGGTLILNQGGNGSFNGESIVVNGSLIMNGTTTLISSCSACNNGNTGTGSSGSGVTFGPDARLVYNVPTGFTKAFGSEISRAGTNPRVSVVTVNTNNSIDRLLTTQSVGNANYANTVWIEDTLNLNGIIEIGDVASETVYLRRDVVLTGASTTNYVLITKRVEASGQRGFRRYMRSGETLLFPVAVEANGTIERYTPFLITNNGASQSFSFSANEPDSWAIDGLDNDLFPEMENNFTNTNFNSPSNPRIQFYDMIEDIRWDIDAFSGSGDISMKVGFGAFVTIGSHFPLNQGHYFFHNTGSSTWDEYGAAYLASDAAVFNLPSLTLGNAFISNDFGAFGFGSLYFNSLLPVELNSFNAKEEGSTNKLIWKVESELNCMKYEIQRSDDAINYNTIGSVKSNNIVDEYQEYSFLDVNPLMENYYRLKIKDYDLTYEYSDVVSIKRESDIETNYSIYPNPAFNVVSIKSEQIDLVGSIKIMDATGNIVVNLSKSENVKGVIDINIDRLAKGIYFVWASDKSIGSFIKQ